LLDKIRKPDTKHTSDVIPLFKKEKDAASRRPNILISYGAQNFRQAYNKDFGQAKIYEPSISVMSGYRATTITTSWRGSTMRLEIEKSNAGIKEG
jgi:hypothetical protein